jgi:hypothetical protein
MESKKPAFSRLQKCEFLIAKGYTYNPKSGEVISPEGNVIKSKSDIGYGIISIYHEKKCYQLRTHDFAYYCHHKELPIRIKHINGINNDDRIENLEPTTHQKNCTKRKAKGYVFVKATGKYQAQLTVNGKLVYLGSYDTAEKAHMAYLSVKNDYHQ